MWIVYMCFGVGAYNIWKGIKDYLELQKLRKNGKKIEAQVSSVGEGKDGFFYKLTYQDESGLHELRYDLPRSAKKKNLLLAGAEACLFVDPKNSSRLILEDRKKERADLAFSLSIGILIMVMGVFSLMETGSLG